MNTADGSSPDLRTDPGPAVTSDEAPTAGRGNSFIGDAWGHAGRAASRDRSDLRSSHARPRNAALGPVLSTAARWSRHGPTLAEKRQALAALIERRNAGNKSHNLLSRIYSARTEIIAMEIALA